MKNWTKKQKVMFGTAAILIIGGAVTATIYKGLGK